MLQAPSAMKKGYGDNYCNPCHLVARFTRLTRLQDCGWPLVLVAFLTVLAGTLAAVVSDIADTTVVQTVARLLVRGQPF
jgi:hypothetical protein